MIRYIVPGAPVATNQGYAPARWGKRHGFVLTAAGADYKTRLFDAGRIALIGSGAKPIEDRAVVAVRFVFPTLGSDVDGPAKFVLDSVSPGTRHHPGAGIVVNDNRVRKLIVEKADCDGSPRTEIAVSDGVEGRCPACGCVCGMLLPRRTAAGDNALEGLKRIGKPKARPRLVSSVRRYGGER